MEARELRNAINTMYSRLNYDQFCSYMGFDPKYDERYWDDFRGLCNAVSNFDDMNLNRIINYSPLPAQKPKAGK